jgi:hypothetical protein
MDAPGEASQMEREVVRDRIAFHGHPLISALHQMTIEITTEDRLTKEGDCIVGVGADIGCAGLDEAVKERIRDRSSRVLLRLVVGSDSFEVKARGDARLALTHPHDIVVRKSDFISDRTIAVGADAASNDIPRRMIAALRRPETVGYLEVEVR